MSNIDVTVIIPYYNENETILTTIDLISKQTFLPKEVIFVNSNSVDGTSETIDKWINNNNKLYASNFKNVEKGTTTPGSSKNIGIRMASTKWVAFMDCGLFFPLNWLEKQWRYKEKSNCDVVSGVCLLKGINYIDIAAVTQTYGFLRIRPCVPSSLVKKKLFQRTGLFLENRRAGYDSDWLLSLKKLKINRKINSETIVKYNGVNFSDTFLKVFKKSVLYAIPTIGLKYYRIPYYYLACFLVFFLSFYFSLILSIVLFSIYFIFRGFIIPVIKSRSVKQYFMHPIMIILIPFVGLIIDLGKIIGFFIGIKNNIPTYFRKNTNE